MHRIGVFADKYAKDNLDTMEENIYDRFEMEKSPLGELTGHHY